MYNKIFIYVIYINIYNKINNRNLNKFGGFKFLRSKQWPHWPSLRDAPGFYILTHVVSFCYSISHHSLMILYNRL